MQGTENVSCVAMCHSCHVFNLTACELIPVIPDTPWNYEQHHLNLTPRHKYQVPAPEREGQHGTPMDPLSCLGDFEIAPIIELLDPIDIIRLQRVSRAWRELLSSEYIARIALIAHFPRTAEAVDFRDSPTPSSVILPYRRAAYRFHTRRLGLPTKVHEVLLDCSDGDSIEWDAADGFAAWTSHEDRVLRIQSLTGGPSSKILVELDKCCLNDGQISHQDLRGARLNVQMGKGLLVVTLNFYDTPEDGYGFGRRALILVFSIPAAALLWKLPIHLPQRLLGEVDFAQDRLTYIRKMPQNKNSQSSVVLHFVAHDVHTGSILLETELERSWEISNGEQFFVMVTDRPFRRLIILHEDTDVSPSLWGPVFVRVFSINDGPPGKLLAKYDLRHSPFLGNRVGPRVFIESDLYMDYPPKGEVFWVVESCFVFVDKRLERAPHNSNFAGSSSNPEPHRDLEEDLEEEDELDSGDEGGIMPKTVAFSAWSVQPISRSSSERGFEMVQSVYRSHIDETRDFQRRFDIATDIPPVPLHPFPTAPAAPPVLPPPSVSLDHLAPQNGLSALPLPLLQRKRVAYRDRCQRFEIFLPEEQCSATFYNVKPAYEPGGEFTGGMRRFRIDVGSYQFAGVEKGGERIMDQKQRKTLTGRLLTPKTGGAGGEAFRVVADLSDDGKGECRGRLRKKVLEVRGEVYGEFLHGVQWSERHLALRTRWKRGDSTAVIGEGTGDERLGEVGGMQAGIVVFDFGSPW